ncbi:MAG: helix-turn-helix transcriptional regulator [Clostridia bacterium]|nr:helix-turn-helix transcriptional regulator [Clostridia bacterium]
MLHENIRKLRKAKGLSQEELAVELNVVRQTVSKWEQGLSVPDADLLIALSEVLEVPVSTLLGETIAEPEPNEWKAISEKLEVINRQLAQRQKTARKALHWFFILLSSAIVLLFFLSALADAAFSNWNWDNTESAIAGTFLHGFVWFFFRIAPFALAGSFVGIVLTRKKQ